MCLDLPATERLAAGIFQRTPDPLQQLLPELLPAHVPSPPDPLPGFIRLPRLGTMTDFLHPSSHISRIYSPPGWRIGHSQLRQYSMKVQPLGLRCFANIGRITAPRIINQPLLVEIISPDADRIKVDVGCQSRKIPAARFHRDRLVPPLEQMPSLTVPCIEPLGVGALHPLHSHHQIRFRRFQQEMIMVPQQRVRMHPPSRALADFAQRCQEHRAVGIPPEYLLQTVSPAHYVVDRPRIFHSGFSWHAPFTSFLPVPRQFILLIYRTDPFGGMDGGRKLR